MATLQSQMKEIVLSACVRELKGRQAKTIHPAGSWDHHGHFIPALTEWCPVCDTIKRDNFKGRQRFIAHCRSIGHVAHLYHVHPRDLRRKLKESGNG